MNEPFSRVLQMPWDEMLKTHAEAQQLEGERDPSGALMSLLRQLGVVD
jgi:hypothetical protein